MNPFIFLDRRFCGRCYNIKPACRLCGRIVTATWQGREGSGEKQIWNANDLQRHLIEWHKSEWTTQIERSIYKNILAVNRCSFTPENFEMYRSEIEFKVQGLNKMYVLLFFVAK
jgi:hypothetical protein